MSLQAIKIWLNRHAFLLIPLVLYLLLAVLYMLAVPIGESPDEPGHLQCIQQVSLLGQLPQIDPKPEGEPWWSRGRIISGRMCYHMPLYYLLAGGVQWVTATAASEPIAYEFPPTNQNFGPNPAMFDHAPKRSFWAITEPTHLLALRFLSVVLGGVTVWASYAVARQLWPQQPIVALLAGLLTAVWPQFVYLSRALNNDSLATALAVVLLVVLLKTQQPRRFLWAALLAVLAIFTKLSVAFTAVAVLLTWGLEFWHFPAQRKQYLRVLFGILALFALGFLLLFLTPTLWQHFSQSSTAFSTQSDAIREWTYWQDVLQLTASSGWVRFGWMNVAAPQWHAYVWWGVILGAALIGCLYILHAQKKITVRLQLAIMLMWLLLIGLSYLQINLNRLQPQFRFALASIPVICSLTAIGWMGLFRGNGRWQKFIVTAIGVSLLFYNYWVIFKLIDSTYNWWQP